MEELISTHAVNPGYKWDQFSVQNELVLNALKLTDITYEVMDAYFVNILRPDMHYGGGDCLHMVRQYKACINGLFCHMCSAIVHAAHLLLFCFMFFQIKQCLPKDNTYSWLFHHIMRVKYQ